MNTTPISVLISVYAKEAPSNLDEALSSIYNQTLMPEEVVLVEDGKLTKELYEVIERWEKQGQNMNPSVPLRRVRLQENVKLGRALAAGMKECKNEIIARMDSDDIARPERFAHEYAFLKKHPEISVVGSNIEEFMTDESKPRRIKHMPQTPAEVYRYGKLRNPLNHMSVMMRKQAVLSVGGYEHFPLLEDYYLWSRMLASGYKLANVPETLIEARIDHSFSLKRGGPGYFTQYKKLRVLQLKMGYTNKLEYIQGLILCAGVVLMPRWGRDVVYKMLRRKTT